MLKKCFVFSECKIYNYNYNDALSRNRIRMFLFVAFLFASWACTLGDSVVGAQSLTHASALQSANLIQENTHKDVDVETPPQLRIIHPSTKLFKYQAYKDISILHFNIPEDAGKAVFMFKANTLGARCTPEDITIYLKFGSFPVISEEDIPFPDNFLNKTERPKIHHIEFVSNNELHYINLDNPLPGDWFAIAFISYTDPKHDKIEQQGIAASCETKLISELSIILGRTIEVKTNQNYSLELKNSVDRRIFLDIPEDYDEVDISVQSLVECRTCEMTLKLHNFTYSNDTIITNTIEEKFTLENKTKYMRFNVDNNSSYYLDLNIKEPSMSIENFTVNVQLNANINESAASEFQFDALDPDDVTFQEYPLVRQTFSELFRFDYILLPDENGTTPPMLNITSEKPIMLKFPIYSIHDIGGTLTVGVNLQIDTSKYIKDSGFDLKNQVNYTLLACLRRDEVGIPELPNNCVYENSLELPANLNVNNAKIESSMAVIHVPYPEPGDWHLLFKLFCDNVILDDDSLNKQFLNKNLKQLQNFNKDCECYALAMNISQNSSLYSNLTDAEVQQMNQCLFNPFCSNNFSNLTMDYRLMKEKNGVCETSFTFTISSSPCIGGKCSPYGICLGNRNGGFLYSTCVCYRNYRGWDCSNGDEALSTNQLLLDILLLTLSNLLFVGSTIYAVRERYYTEAIVYAFTCFFSTFYHACDAGEDIYSFCIVKLSVLQFSDFYCGLLSIWVTLVAMANLKQIKYKSILHMLGCVLLAFGTQLDKTSLWVFLMPAITGLLLVAVAWSLQYRRRRKCHLTKRYWIFLPIGFVTVAVGLVCYAFLQTNDNYSIIHSCWHLIMALSIILLLPSRNSFIPLSLTDNNLIQNSDNELPITNPDRMVENNLLDNNNVATIYQRNTG